MASTPLALDFTSDASEASVTELNSFCIAVYTVSMSFGNIFSSDGIQFNVQPPASGDLRFAFGPARSIRFEEASGNAPSFFINTIDSRAASRALALFSGVPMRLNRSFLG